MPIRRLCLSALLLLTCVGAAGHKPAAGKDTHTAAKATHPPAKATHPAKNTHPANATHPAKKTATKPAPKPAPTLAAKIDRYLQPYVALDLFQGAVLVARGDQVLFQKGYGNANVELGVKNTPASVFRIASLTKVFTEVLLGRLAEQGKLELDAPLSRYLPNFPKGDSITLDMLRLHRAGIPSMNSIPFDEEASEPNTLDSLVRAIAKAPLDFPPGSRRRYSNGGYAVLAAVIEKVTGERYADALAGRVLQPLALNHTFEEADGMLVPGRAYGYTASSQLRHGLEVAPFQQMATKSGGGSLVSTVGDLHRFLRAMYTDKPLRADDWRKLFPPDSEFTYQGRCPGFNVFMGREFAHDVIVVVLCNNYAAGMVGDIGADLIAMAKGREVATPRWRADVKADSARAAVLVGTYRPPPGTLPYGDGPYTLRWHEGQLVLMLGGQPADVLIPQGDDHYLLRNLWSEVHVAPAAAGQSPSVTIRPLWFTTEPTPLQRAS
jgi:CubicO group peptidase (beta-lactamase class C family)